jgi:hypothetical protein
MINSPWDVASPLYKKVVFSSMALSGVGILLAVVGANSGNRPLMYTAVGIILVGLLAHIAGLVVRGRDMKAHRQANPPAGPVPPRNKGRG